jgi:hypothetical protein
MQFLGKDGIGCDGRAILVEVESEAEPSWQGSVQIAKKEGRPEAALFD